MIHSEIRVKIVKFYMSNANILAYLANGYFSCISKLRMIQAAQTSCPGHQDQSEDIFTHKF